ncbi:MAG: DNA repair protein RecO [Candidatus Nealsonbacteria bacterium DGGOD1a]|jgi:DNA repair protein RecO|nr:MAG: DNA repair protein RecO [Candidatus Nealsonbacteria bacterium DGGOD1a]
MFTHYRTQGVIIKKIDRGEADQLLVVYTKDFGRVEVTARGIRKITSKLRPAVEFASVAEIEFIQGKTCKTLTDALIMNLLADSRKDLRKSAALRRICGFAEETIKDRQEDSRIWGLLRSALFFVESADAGCAAAICHYFVWHLLDVAGWRPDFGGEARFDGRPEPNERSIGVQTLALAKFFCDANIERGSLMRLTDRQNDLLLAAARNHLAAVTK